MGYTIFAGCDATADVWQTAVQLNSLRGALQAKCGEKEAGQPNVVCCASVTAPAGSPLVKVVQNTPDGSNAEVVAGGEANKFYSIDQIIAQIGNATSPSVPSGEKPQKAAPQAALAPQAAASPSASGVGLTADKDYVIVLSGKGNCDPWAAAVQTAQLRSQIQEITGGSLPAVINEAAGKAAVTLMAVPLGGSAKEGSVSCSGASIAEVQAGLCGNRAAAPTPAPVAAAPKKEAPAPAPAAAAAAPKPAPPAASAAAAPAMAGLAQAPAVATRSEEPTSPSRGVFNPFRWLSSLARLVCRSGDQQ